MTDINLAKEVASNPHFQKDYLDRMGDPIMRIPTEYGDELEKMLTMKRQFLSGINDIEDFKILVKLMENLHPLKSRVTVIRKHTLALLKAWESLYGDARQFIILEYFPQLDPLKSGSKSDVMEAALFPLKEGINILECLYKQGDMVQKYLEDFSWDVKHAKDMLTEYFALLKHSGLSKEV